MDATSWGVVGVTGLLLVLILFVLVGWRRGR